MNGYKHLWTISSKTDAYELLFEYNVLRTMLSISKIQLFEINYKLLESMLGAYSKDQL